jgi:XTP/dITP diphosphohydrolase
VVPALHLLLWSPRVAPGLLSAGAWDLLRGADRVLAADPDHPLAPSLTAAGVRVEVHAGDASDPVRLAERLAPIAASTTVVWLTATGSDHELVAALHGAGHPFTLTVASSDLPGAEVLDLVRVMDRLRSPGGCAWDAEQTHASLLTYLIEETYETVEAIETDDLVGLREELGDLLLQVVFHARIGQEHVSDAWSLDDIARVITEKLVRRHPHVFSDAPEPGVTAGELDNRWDQQKKAEKGRTSATDGVPMGQPALSLAAKLHDRATRAGVAPALDLAAGDPSATASASGASDDVVLGDLLLSAVVRARSAGLDPEAALRAAARRYADQIRAVEATQQR